MIYLELFISYLKIGFFGFGGGYSMLSLIHHEVVVSHEWISSAALSDIIAISQMTPGPIAINSATYIGYTIAGFWGSVIATIAVCLPSLSIMVIITRFFLKLRNSNYMECIMTAMRPSVIGMIAAASMLLIFPEEKQGASMIDAWSWMLFAAAFVASLRKVSPIKLIVLSAIAGIAIYYIPEVIAPKDETGTTESATSTTLWRGFDITQSEVIESDTFEQAWVDYLYLLQHREPSTAAYELKTTLEIADSSPEAALALFDLCEKYLYNPNSPIRHDELFIPSLEVILDSPKVDSLLKIRPTAMLQTVKLNRVGAVANDFKIVGTNRTMHQVEAPYTLLYFYDPECSDCKRVSAIINRSETLQELEIDNHVAIIKILATENNELDSLYDLKALPTLYLLDDSKRVLLKDATIESIIESLKQVSTK